MKAKYEIAGIAFEIESNYRFVQELCKDYQTEKPAQIHIVTKQEDIEWERRKSADEDCREGIPVRHFSDEYLETLAVYRKMAEQMPDYGIILFHGSAIAVDGVGYLFTAKSGTGKSTHTRLWREQFGERAIMINDDKPLLRITAEGVTVYGTPWDGKHRLSSNISAPLKAICLLERDRTNHIREISVKEAYPLLLQQTYRSSDTARLATTLQLLDRMLQNTELYSLGCNMEHAAARVAFEGMQR